VFYCLTEDMIKTNFSKLANILSLSLLLVQQFLVQLLLTKQITLTFLLEDMKEEALEVK
jgi:hypothetical protein